MCFLKWGKFENDYKFKGNIPLKRKCSVWKEIHLFFDVWSLLSSCCSLTPFSKSSLCVLPLTDRGDSGTAGTAADVAWGCPDVGPLHFKISSAFSKEDRIPCIIASLDSAVDAEFNCHLSCFAKFNPWISSLISIFCSWLKLLSIAINS